MLVIVRDDTEFSLKTRFFVQLVKLDHDVRLLHVFRNDRQKFTEKWAVNSINLATSVKGIMVYYLMFFLKSPMNLRDGVIRRLNRRKNFSVVGNMDLATGLSQAFYQYFARSARNEGFFKFLNKLNFPKIFLIDEFFSLNVIDLKKLARIGPIIYISSDLAYDFYGVSSAASKLMYRYERDKISLPDLVVACSERDKLKYADMGARKVVYYPNIYPIREFEPAAKNEIPSVLIVLRGHWGLRLQMSLKEVINALGRVERPIRVYMIGVKPQNVPKNIDLHYYEYIPSRLEYLKILSLSWVGINLGIHSGGSNQRKYDYAMAGLIILSDSYGSRGDLIPHEYTYVDAYDLVATLNQLLDLGKEKIRDMGIENRKHVLSLADQKRQELEKVVKTIPSV